MLSSFVSGMGWTPDPELSYLRTFELVYVQKNMVKLTAAASGVKLKDVISVPQASVRPYNKASKYFWGPRTGTKPPGTRDMPEPCGKAPRSPPQGPYRPHRQ